MLNEFYTYLYLISYKCDIVYIYIHKNTNIYDSMCLCSSILKVSYAILQVINQNWSSTDLYVYIFKFTYQNKNMPQKIIKTSSRDRYISYII